MGNGNITNNERKRANNNNNNSSNSYRRVMISKHYDLSKIYDVRTNKIYKVIPSPTMYFDSENNKLSEILSNTLREKIISENFSILGFDNASVNSDNDDDNNVAHLIKFKTGHIALKIPYTKLIKLSKI